MRHLAIAVGQTVHHLDRRSPRRPGPVLDPEPLEVSLTSEDLVRREAVPEAGFLARLLRR